MSQPESSGRRLVAALPRALTWPFRRLLDPRFGGLAQQAETQHLDLATRLEYIQRHMADRQTMHDALSTMRHELTAIARADRDATLEANELIGRSLSDLLDEAGAATASIDRLEQRLSSVRPADVVERPYVYRALARVQPDASILDVGASESMVAFSLASLGYDVTALDLHPYPLAHPRLRSVQADLLEWETTERFDVILCISTLEQVAPASGDARALERLGELTRPGGILVLTVPFGAASTDTAKRSYERTDLERLLQDWTVDDMTVIRQEDSLTWSVTTADEPEQGELRRVALVTATRPK